VPYDILDADAAAPDPLAPQTRARRTSGSNTGRLQAVPGGRREGVTYRPPAEPAVVAPPVGQSSSSASGAYERTYRPRATGSVVSGSTARVGVYALGAVVAAVVLYLAVSTLIHWTQIKLDDIQFGTPRTTHLDAIVGHGDSAMQPTHFIALNLNRQVSIIELPGGDISKATAISGPYLFGDNADLTPVHLEVQDVNGDTKPDLIVTVSNEQLVYINDNNSFRLITADEKAKLEAAPLQAGTPQQ
jgi:hypothetical protein